MRLLVGFLLIFLASCSLNNAEEDGSLEKYFSDSNLTGSFAMFNNGTGKFTVYNMNSFRDSAYPAFGTASIVHSLIGLETGRLKDSTELGAADLTIASLGTDTLKRWLDTLGYNPSSISADEQLGLVKKLYFSQLPFQPRSQRIVKHSLAKEDNSNFILSYQVGEGKVSGGRGLVWITGWVEENNHPYFFVLQTERRSPAADQAATSIQILKNILKQYDFFEGRR